MKLIVIDKAGHMLDEPAAASLVRMRAQGMPGGNVSEAYRSPERQRYFYNLYLSGKGNFALAPGQSIHEVGRAVDFVSAQYRWLEKHGAAHGWRKTNPKERWHYEYEWWNDQFLNAPTPTVAKEDDMTPDQAQQLTDTTNRVANIQNAIGDIQEKIALIVHVIGTSQPDALPRLIASNTRMEKTDKTAIEALTQVYEGVGKIMVKLDVR